MSRKVTVKIHDDLDPSLDADVEVRLGVDGTVYVLDLTEAHAGQLRAELAPWLEAAHETIRDKSTKPKPAPTPRATVPSPAAARAIPDPKLRQAIRAWGRANGHRVATRGSLSPELVEAYHAAHQRGHGDKLAGHGARDGGAAPSAAPITSNLERSW